MTSTDLEEYLDEMSDLYKVTVIWNRAIELRGALWSQMQQELKTKNMASSWLREKYRSAYEQCNYDATRMARCEEALTEKMWQTELRRICPED